MNQQNEKLHQTSRKLFGALAWIKEAGILATANADKLSLALELLDREGFQTPENVTSVIAHVKPLDLAEALLYLQHDSLLTPEIRAVVIKHAHPLNLAATLVYLQRADILTTENQAFIPVFAITNRLMIPSSVLHIDKGHLFVILLI